MFLDALHADLALGDIPGLLSRQRIKFAELAPLYGMTPESARAGLLQQFTELSKDGAWTVEPLRPDDVVRLHLCCGGRVVEPRSARDDQPVLRGQAADGNAWSLPVFISRIDGMFEVAGGSSAAQGSPWRAWRTAALARHPSRFRYLGGGCSAISI